MENKVSILVNTCDSYSDVWEAFFTLFKKYYKDNKYPIYLNTENKSYTFKDLDIHTINYSKKCAWGERLINALNNIDSKYVIFLLDDFLLMSDVNTNIINECIDLMDKDETIVNFCFYPFTSNKEDIDDGLSVNFLRRPDECEYKLNCQAGIWRRELLISYIRKHESPWEWEILGSKRASRYKEKFYLLKPSIKKVFDYDYQKYGIIRGKWSKDTPSFLDKEGIKVDYLSRGFFEKKKKEELPFIKKLNPSYALPVLKRVLHEKRAKHLSLK